MSARLHIGVLARALPHHDIGGMQAVTWDLVTSFVSQGMKVTVVTAAIPGRPERFEDSGVHVWALPGTSWRRYGWKWWRATRRVFECELRESCDLIFSVSAGGFGLLRLRSRTPEIPFVMQAHGTSLGEAISKWRSRSLKSVLASMRNVAWIAKDLLAYRRFDVIIAVGDRVAGDFSKWPMRLVVERRLRTIRNGVDTELFRPSPDARAQLRERLGWGPEIQVVVTPGRLHKQKGLHHGLDAFALLSSGEPACDFRYLIVGDGPELPFLKKRAVDLGVESKVRFVGSVSRGEIADYLNAADAMLFTTTHVEAGSALTVLEALAVGLPVVASDHLNLGMEATRRVALVDPTDSNAVALALRRALGEAPVESDRLPREFTLSASVAAYASLFAELVHRVT